MSEIRKIEVEGVIYKTVKIGNQIWMAGNLDAACYRNGDPIEKVTSHEDWQKAGEAGKPVCCYFNFKRPEIGYGRLYNWFALSDPRGIAPKGWHVPTDSEWKNMEFYLGMDRPDLEKQGDGARRGKDIGKKIMAKKGWYDEGVGTNASGFAALPGGFCKSNGEFSASGYMSDWACFWTATEFDAAHAWCRRLLCVSPYLSRDAHDKKQGYSIRLVKDRLVFDRLNKLSKLFGID